MDIHTGRQRRFPALAIVVVSLILCIVPGQFYLSKLFPSLSGLAQINPSLVFLEIPVQLPVAIDLVLVPGLFLLLYPVVLLFNPFRPGIVCWRQSMQRIRRTFAGLFVLLCCVLAGGLIYYLVQDHLTTEIRNGINSMGFIADVHLAYPGHETIYLRGSLVLFVCFLIGLLICIRKIRKEPASQLTREQRMTPYERMLQEKRMNEKQLKQERINTSEHMAEKSWQPVRMDQEIIDPHRNGHAGVCYSQPVRTIRPEAMYFMPK
jgi:hypothetical protein